MRNGSSQTKYKKKRRNQENLKTNPRFTASCDSVDTTNIYWGRTTSHTTHIPGPGEQEQRNLEGITSTTTTTGTRRPTRIQGYKATPPTRLTLPPPLPAVTLHRTLPHYPSKYLPSTPLTGNSHRANTKGDLARNFQKYTTNTTSTTTHSKNPR